MSLTLKFLVFTIFFMGITLVANQTTVAQSQKVNSVNRSVSTERSPEQPPVAEVQISKKQVVIGVAVTAAVTICELFQPCKKVLDTFRGILGGSQTPLSPQMFNRSTQQLVPTGNRRNFSPF